MEKKTIGDFIATLRKANGMTQKELAERLNVSDKTVSRWERNDGTPDLSLIPVIAEIFNISCDELLRGERKPVSERTNTPIDNEATSPKAEKQRQRLLKASLSSYKTKTSITMCISIVGLISALICNFIATQALLGFLIGVVFFAISIICQKIFINKAFLYVEDSELAKEQLYDYKKNVYKQADKSIGLTIFFLGFTFPLAFVPPYHGINTESCIWGGSAFAIIFLILYALKMHFSNYKFTQKHIDLLNEKQLIVYNHNKKLKQKCFIFTITLLTILSIIHILGAIKLWSGHNIASIYEFTIEDNNVFIYDYACASSEINGITFYEFRWNNQDLCSYNYTETKYGIFPITAVTTTDYFNALVISDIITIIYSVLYPIEIISILVYYSKKKMKYH